MSAPPTRPALRARYDRRRQRVVEIAARVFAERGYQATAVSDLAEATGLAAGGLYHYIGSKERLLARICDDLMEPLLEQARRIAGDDRAPAEQLRDLLRTWMTHVERHRHHMLVFQQERHVLERGPQWRAIRRRRKEFEVLLDAVLERGERLGVLDLPDRGLVLKALLGMVNHTPQWFRASGRLSAEQVADGYCDMLLRAYAAAGDPGAGADSTG